MTSKIKCTSKSIIKSTLSSSPSKSYKNLIQTIYQDGLKLKATKQNIKQKDCGKIIAKNRDKKQH